MTNWLFPERNVDLDAVDPEEVDVPALDVAGIDPGTSVLVAGPPLTGKRRLAFDVVGGSASKTACLVSTKGSHERVREWFGATVDDVDAWTLSLVDCSGSGRTGASRRDSQRESKTDVSVVSTPGDLTGIGIKLSGVMQGWSRSGVEDPRLGLHSLSTMLMYADFRRVFQFLHVVSTRLKHVGAISVFTLSTASRETETVKRLTQLFDAVVDVRDGERGPEFRVRGKAFGPATWTRL